VPPRPDAGRPTPGAAGAPPRVLYFGTYDRSVGRNTVVLEALRAAGVPVAECHTTLWRDTAAKLRAIRAGPGLLAARQALAWPRLVQRYRQCGPYDVMVVGATAHLDLPLARALASAAGRPLVFDPLVSVLETVRDRQLLGSDRRLRLLAGLERALLRLPDRVWMDTQAHAEALHLELGLDRARVRVVPAAAPAVFRSTATPYVSRRPRAGRPMRVVYYGQYIPLHGVDVVLRAAHLLRSHADIEFHLVGRGQVLPAALRLARDLALPNVRFHAEWLPPAELAERHIAPADVCLGAFGSEPKARRVVPFKVYAALAAGRAAVTADTEAVREMLRPGLEVTVVPPRDAPALAATLRRLADRPAERAALAASGRAAYDERFAPPAMGEPLRRDLATLVAAFRRPYTGPRHAWRTERLAALLAAAAPPGALLDAGCGDGRTAHLLASGGRRVFAVDRDLPRLLAAARARTVPSGHVTPNPVLFACADVTRLPFAPRSLAGVTAGEVLEHVRDDAAAARELARVLVPGGALAASVPAGADRFTAADGRVGHWRRYDRGPLERLLRGSGLCGVRVEGWGFPFGRWYDALVQRPALAARHSPACGVFAAVGRRRSGHALWRLLFRLESLWPAGDRGSGWWATATRPGGTPPGDGPA